MKTAQLHAADEFSKWLHAVPPLPPTNEHGQITLAVSMSMPAWLWLALANGAAVHGQRIEEVAGFLLQEILVEWQNHDFEDGFPTWHPRAPEPADEAIRVVPEAEGAGA